jgi:DNA-binding NtrC family response regulator
MTWIWPAGGLSMTHDESLFEMAQNCEHPIIMETLSQTNGSQTKAAKSLRTPLSSWNRKIKQLKIDPNQRRAL